MSSDEDPEVITSLFDIIEIKNKNQEVISVKYKLSKDVYIVKSFIETILLILKSDDYPQNYLVLTAYDVTQLDTIAQQFILKIKKYANGSNRKYIDDVQDRLIIQNLFDWLIKQIHKTVYTMPPPRYTICEHGMVIKTLLEDLDAYATNTEDYLEKTK